MSARRLSANQRAVLDVLRAQPLVWFTCPDLAAAVGAPPEGVSRTVGSLRKRGLVQVEHRPRAMYRAIVEAAS